MSVLFRLKAELLFLALAVGVLATLVLITV